MKVILLQKKISTNVIAYHPDEALRLLLDTDECEGYEVTTVQIGESATTNAYRQTCDFVEATDTHVLGYQKSVSEEAKLDPTASPTVWIVSVDLQFIVDYTKMQQPKPDPVPPMDEEAVLHGDPDIMPIRPDLADIPG